MTPILLIRKLRLKLGSQGLQGTGLGAPHPGGSLGGFSLPLKTSSGRPLFSVSTSVPPCSCLAWPPGFELRVARMLTHSSSNPSGAGDNARQRGGVQQMTQKECLDKSSIKCYAGSTEG